MYLRLVEYVLNQWCTEDFEKGKKAIRSQPNVVSEKIYLSGSKKKIFNLNQTRILRFSSPKKVFSKKSSSV